MTEQHKRLVTEAASLARMIATLEGTIAEVKVNYWSKVAELHSSEVDAGIPIVEAIEKFSAANEAADNVFEVAKGAVTCDDT